MYVTYDVDIGPVAVISACVKLCFYFSVVNSMKPVCSAQKKNGAESTWEGDRIFSLFLMSIYYTTTV